MSDWMFEVAATPQPTGWDDPALAVTGTEAWQVEPLPGNEGDMALMDGGKGTLTDFDLMLFGAPEDEDATPIDDIDVTHPGNDDDDDPWWEDPNTGGDGPSGDDGFGPDDGGGGTEQDHGGSGGGYRGGPTPDGFTPHEDGTGRFMYDDEGRLHINPNYQAWLRHNDQSIDWGGVARDLATIVGPSYGTIAVGAARNFIGWGIGSVGEWLSRENDDNDDE